MSPNIQHLDPTRMLRVDAALQHLQEHPERLERARHRFSQTPPPRGSLPETEPPSPGLPPVQRSASETDELFRQPFNNDELHHLRHFNAYRPGQHRYPEEADQERERIYHAYFERDEKGHRTYKGPELRGRAGTDRCRIMIRNAIRKRWERLDVWNHAWGIPGHVNREDNDKSLNWTWEWADPRYPVWHNEWTWAQQVAEWPSPAQETVGERSVRQFVQEAGRWSGQVKIAEDEVQFNDETDVDPRESFITSRPWFQYQLEIYEERERLQRIQPEGYFETAIINANARWRRDGRWKNTWGQTPDGSGDMNRHRPSQKTQTTWTIAPSEIDALEVVPPPTPPPEPLSQPAATDRPRLVFGYVREHEEYAENMYDLSEADIAGSDLRVKNDNSEHPDESIVRFRDSQHPQSNLQGYHRSSQRLAEASTKQRRDMEEGTREDDGVLSTSPKHASFVKQVSETEGLDSYIRAKNRPKRNGISQISALAPSSTSNIMLGTLWLDSSSPRSLTAVQTIIDTHGHSERGQPMRLRRSARLAAKKVNSANSNDMLVPAAAPNRVAESRAKHPTQKTKSKTSKQLQPRPTTKGSNNTKKVPQVSFGPVHNVKSTAKARRRSRRR